MEWLIVCVIITAITFVLLSWGKRAELGEEPSYRLRKHFLTPAERSFYGVLEGAVAGRFKVHTMVRVADVLQPAGSRNRCQWQSAFNRISSKHFDYVLCDPETLEVKAAIELNDSSHLEERRRARDDFLYRACESAGFKLLFFEAKAKYSVQQIKERLDGI
ncbi:MAG: DUF2726 domain-containing protein [Pseudomonadales bacterium]|nr:DUF2726 domain-containing protein [Pseudomonadales bacterium]